MASKFDYYKLNPPKHVNARRDSGGLIVYFRNELSPYIAMVKTIQNNLMWLK